MATDVTKYLDELAREAGASDEERQVLTKVLSSEKAAKRLTNDLMRHDEYSSKMDKLRADADAFEGQKTTWKGWYDGVVRDTEANKHLVEEAQARVKAYADTYGELEGPNGKSLVVTPADSVSRKEYDETMNRISANAIALTKDAMYASADYLKRFGEVLDPDELEKFALDKKLPLKQAYREYISPRLSEQEKTAHETALKNAKDEGAREERSRLKVPIDTGPKQPHPFFDRTRPTGDKPAPTGRELRDGFVEAFNTPVAAPAK